MTKEQVFYNRVEEYDVFFRRLKNMIQKQGGMDLC